MGKMTTHPDEFSVDFDRIYAHNKWFGKDQVMHALSQWSVQLNQDDLIEWTAQYAMNMTHSKTIALVLAGNLPLVGFHDILTALISGHRILCKTSSKDPIHTRLILDMLTQIEPGFVQFLRDYRPQMYHLISFALIILPIIHFQTVFQTPYYPKIIWLPLKL